MDTATDVVIKRRTLCNDLLLILGLLTGTRSGIVIEKKAFGVITHHQQEHQQRHPGAGSEIVVRRSIDREDPLSLDRRVCDQYNGSGHPMGTMTCTGI